VLIDLSVYMRNDPGNDPLSQQQRDEVLAAFPASVEVKWNPENFGKGGQPRGLAVDTIVIAAIAAAGGQFSAGLFGQIGIEARQGIKRGLARLLRRRTDVQYSTNGTAYVLLNRADGKTVALECVGAVLPGEQDTLSDEKIEERLSKVLDAYREKETELGELLEAATRSDKLVLLVNIINGQLTVGSRTFTELGLPEQS
jgi:hypothetical protein